MVKTGRTDTYFAFVKTFQEDDQGLTWHHEIPAVQRRSVFQQKFQLQLDFFPHMRWMV